MNCIKIYMAIESNDWGKSVQDRIKALVQTHITNMRKADTHCHSTNFLKLGCAYSRKQEHLYRLCFKLKIITIIT